MCQLHVQLSTTLFKETANFFELPGKGTQSVLHLKELTVNRKEPGRIISKSIEAGYTLAEDL